MVTMAQADPTDATSAPASSRDTDQSFAGMSGSENQRPNQHDALWLPSAADTALVSITEFLDTQLTRDLAPDTQRTALIPLETAAEPKLPACLSEDVEKATELARQEKAKATRRAYRSDFALFEEWCSGRGINALPATPESVAAFLACEVERSIRPSTIGRRIAAIRYAHKLAGHAVPTDDERVRATVRGIRRTLGTAPRKKSPATAERIIAMALGTGDGLKGLRDRALLLLGFAGAFRRSELVALDCEDLEECETGLRVLIRRGKTDQEGQGAAIGIVRGSIACPVAAVRAWREAAGIAAGPLFRSVRKGGKVGGQLTAQSVADIVKAHAERVGLDPALFAGHSLRAGFLTSAAKRGASVFKMMDVSRHRSVDALRGYIRDADIFQNHAGEGLL
jgi:site-specific recombinase XerD